MFLFPSGSGMVSVIVFVVSVILFNIKKLKNIRKYISIFMAVTLVYSVIGGIVFFRPPFMEIGHTYFPSGVFINKLEDKISKVNSSDEFLSLLFPENEVLDNEAFGNTVYTAASGSEQPVNAERKYLYGNTNISITVKSMDDKNLLKEEFLYETEHEKEFLRLNPKKDYMTDCDKNAFCILPAGFDGTKFFLPFVDADGAAFHSYFYFEDGYVIINETARNINKLDMPEYLNSLRPQ